MSVAEALETASAAATADFLAAQPPEVGARVTELPGLTAFAVTSAPFSTYLNQVQVLAPRVEAADLARAVALLGLARDPLIRVPEWSAPALPPRFEAAERLVRMTMRLEALPAPRSLPGGIRVELTTDATLVAGVTAEGAVAVAQSAALGRPGWRAAVALGPDGPVGAGLSFCRDGMVYCGNAAVLPAWRRRDIHTALLLARLRTAAAEGAGVLSMLAEEGSASQASAAGIGATVAHRVQHYRR